MGTMSAAEAKLDAAIRPEITMLRSRSSYPVRHRQARPPARRPGGADDAALNDAAVDGAGDAAVDGADCSRMSHPVVGSGGAGRSLHSVLASNTLDGRVAAQCTPANDATPLAWPAGVSSAIEPSAGAVSAGVESAGIVSAAVIPAGAVPAGTRSASVRPAGMRPAGVRPAGVRPAGARPAGVRSGQRAPVRLTRRGRVVVAVVCGVVIVAVAGLLWLLVAGQAEASNYLVSGRPGGQGMIRVVVRPGQTLWGIALRAQPTADPRIVIQEIVDVNSLSGPAIQVGEVLWVPRG